jgi:hypothetical protein
LYSIISQLHAPSTTNVVELDKYPPYFAEVSDVVEADRDRVPE